jgi:hypothetical protein
MAYESTCSTTGDLSNLDASICAPPGQDECDSGIDAARGRMLGEHTKLTVMAISNAGLPASVLATPAFPPYFSPNKYDPSGALTLEPAITSAMERAENSRVITIAELAQVPDWSYSLPDFLLGNEHCVAPNIPGISVDDIKACHVFVSHMGAVNSTHFAPQNRAMYNLYHGLAMQTAARCASMKSAFDPTNTNLMFAATNTQAVAICEREALALQAIGSHYQADAWSSGHMWQRWGSPEFATDPQEQTNAQVVGMISGLTHGWRGAVREHPKLLWLAAVLTGGDLTTLQHDQLCYPGPFGNESDIVSWTYPGSEDPTIPGGGDLYLEACPDNPTWSVLGSPELQMQKNRMLSCMALGFAEVYVAGPMSLGQRGPMQVQDDALKTSQDDLCWNQRNTNKSMELGWGISGLRGLSQSPDFWTKVGLFETFVSGSPLESPNKSVSDRLAVELPMIFFRTKWLAQKSPDTTEAAELADPGLQKLLGLNRNQALKDHIESGGVPYLEPPDMANWNKPTQPSDVTCLNDSYCPAGSYCAQATVDGSERHCVPFEVAIMSAYRQAEQPAWCTRDKNANMNEAIKGCATQIGPNACEACVAVLRAHLRNACDRASWSEKLAGISDIESIQYDHRSMCDVYGSQLPLTDQPDFLYLPYDPTVTGAADQALRDFCETGGQIKTESFQYSFQTSPPTTPQWFDAPFATAIQNTCGAGVGEHWWLFETSAGSYKFSVTAAPLTDSNGIRHSATNDDLLMQIYQGPDCTTLVGQAPIGTPVAWSTAPNSGFGEVCVRIKVQHYQVWTSFVLHADTACSDVSCPAGQQCCGGNCVDPTSDSANCGGCGRSCPGTEQCVGQTCMCPGEQVICNYQTYTCTDLKSDPQNCGACGSVCNTSCVGGCCLPDTTCPPQSSPNKTLSCPSSLERCGVALVNCVDPDTDNGNCGGCGNICPGADAEYDWYSLHPWYRGELCKNARCGCPGTPDTYVPGPNSEVDLTAWVQCTPGSDRCIDLNVDFNNCSACGHRCPYPATNVCFYGECICTKTLCGQLCTATEIDPQNCGRCGNVCPSQTPYCTFDTATFTSSCTNTPPPQGQLPPY